MNPFELQAELARQWFALAGGLASTVLTVWTSQVADSVAYADQLPPTRAGDAISAATAVSPLNAAQLMFNPVMALAPWAPWVCPKSWSALFDPRKPNVVVADRASANYRSAGGHAVATIIAPGRTETR